MPTSPVRSSPWLRRPLMSAPLALAQIVLDMAAEARRADPTLTTADAVIARLDVDPIYVAATDRLLALGYPTSEVRQVLTTAQAQLTQWAIPPANQPEAIVVSHEADLLRRWLALPMADFQAWVALRQASEVREIAAHDEGLLTLRQAMPEELPLAAALDRLLAAQGAVERVERARGQSSDLTAVQTIAAIRRLAGRCRTAEDLSEMRDALAAAGSGDLETDLPTITADAPVRTARPRSARR